MGQFHDTLREELGEILDKLQELQRKNYPNTILLFLNGGASFTTQDVARTTSLQAPKRGIAPLDYSIYVHNFYQGNKQVGQLHTEAKMGQIEVGYLDGANPKRFLRFKMDVGSGSRVFNYTVQGSDRITWHPNHTKSTVISYLEQLFRD